MILLIFFRFKGRLYDTCVTLDNDPNDPSAVAWCSTENGGDDGLDYIGKKAECQDDCWVSNCPVGFYPNYPEKGCYQVTILLSMHVSTQK